MAYNFSKNRKLANNASKNASSIEDILNSIREKINNAFKTVEKSEESLNKILVDIKQISDLNTRIATATKEQMVASKDILYSVQSLTDITGIIQDSIQLEKKDSEQIVSTINKLVDIAENIRYSIEEQLKNSHEILKSIEEVGDITKDNNDVSVELGQMIRKFKVEKKNRKRSHGNTAKSNGSKATGVKPVE